ncbi:MAG: zinc ABC transporter substrate-binding protein [Chloroflexi bacterium]|nr:zinc ABC transporter substrate-binding protein [Chloroflexota bacterium]
MNSINKFLVILLAAIIVLAGVGGAAAQNDRYHIVTTIFPIFDFTRIVAGDTMSVTLILPAGADSHSFEPTPSDIMTVQDADLFLYIGGESDGWVDRILSSFGDKKPATVALIQSVRGLNEEIVEGMQHDSSHDEHDDDGDEYHDENDDEKHDDDDDNDESDSHSHSDGVIDEHIWTSPTNAILMTEKIRDALSALDPANSALFAANAEAYINELKQLDADFRSMVASSKRKVFVVGDRFPFRYLAHDYGLEYYAAFPGCSTDNDPGASTVAFLIDKVREYNLPVVFTLENSNQVIAKTIADATGARVEVLNAAHNVGGNANLEQTSYLSIMHENVEKLREALN